MQLMPYSLHADAPHSACFKRTVCNMHGPPMSPLHLPTQSAICCGISSNHIAPSRKLCSVLGRSLRAMGKAGQMSSDTHKLCRCGRKHSANMPLSRQAWLAEDSSRLCKRRRRAALHAHRGGTHALSMLMSRKMKQQRWVQVLNKRAAESRRVQARCATIFTRYPAKALQRPALYKGADSPSVRLSKARYNTIVHNISKVLSNCPVDQHIKHRALPHPEARRHLYPQPPQP